MSRLIALVGWLGLMVVGAAEPARVVQCFDDQWRFRAGEVSDAFAPEYDDGSWRSVKLPHDWSIEGPFAATNASSWGGGYLPSGVGWYRKSFSLAGTASGRRVFIEFDGVMANSDIWINGHHLGHRPNGYVSFRYDLTPYLRLTPSASNSLAVRVDTSQQPASRWYTGAGIYRHVRLVFVNDLHIGYHATFVTTSNITAHSALIQLRTQVTNTSTQACAVTVRATIYGPSGSAPEGRYACAGESQLIQIPSGECRAVLLEVLMPWAPRLWDPACPELHEARVSVVSANRTVDDETLGFGIRDARFEPATGFWLNGRNVKLKGVCLHHDAGGVGTAVPLRVWERRLELLRDIGCNAIRTSHNPVAPGFLDLCDRMGFLVMDEMFDAWRRSKVPYDYGKHFSKWWQQDLTDTIRRDRNHPSIIIYSLGNEIHDVLYDPPLGLEVLRPLRDLAHATDPTRPITVACNQPARSRIHETGFVELMDVAGYNYAEEFALEGRQKNPARKIIGTENAKSPAAWRAVRDHTDLPGMFAWTGFDYFGESVRRWPYLSFQMGMFDRIGRPRAVARQFEAFWSGRPVAYLARMEAQPALPSGTKIPREGVLDWNPPQQPGEPVDIEIYSNCEEIELFLNDRSLGARPVLNDCSPLKWSVGYEPGVLRVCGRNSASVVCHSELRTAGAPVRLDMSADRPEFSIDREDVCHVAVAVVDAAGTVVPTAEVPVTFAISGPGQILMVDNGDLKSHELFQGERRSTFQGRCLAVVQSTGQPGKIALTVSASGLAGAAIEFQTVLPEASRSNRSASPTK